MNLLADCGKDAHSVSLGICSRALMVKGLQWNLKREIRQTRKNKTSPQPTTAEGVPGGVVGPTLTPCIFLKGAAEKIGAKKKIDAKHRATKSRQIRK